MKSSIICTIMMAAVLVQGCSSKVYNNKSFLDQVNLEGKKVAILPVEVELTGRLPKDFSEAKKLQSEESESKAIQSQIYSQYLFKSKSGSKKKKYVNFLSADQVNGGLTNAGIDVRKSWAMDPDSLGRILGADMVLKVRVKKNRIMSDAASFGVGVATSVLGSILNGNNNSGVGTSVNGGAKTYNMYFDATLTDVGSHTVVTKFTHDGDASWNRPPEEIVEASGRKIVRKGAVYAQK
jgi:hypothetical protein